MIKKIKLENYKCYENSQIQIKDLAVIVGRNNVGKSTLIEALRIIAMATKMCVHTTYKEAPRILRLPKSTRGFRVPVEKLKIDLRGCIYYYRGEIAKLTAFFENKIKMIVYINSEMAFATIINEENQVIKSSKKAKDLNISSIGILPQISVIKENEKMLSNETVNKDIDTYLSSRHFRNEVYLYQDEYFEEFRMLAEETWPGLKIKNLDYNVLESDNINLFIEDSRFLAEIGLMGSGLQMWLQIIWFICRSRGCETVILDEPDVYMHPDMQLKILKIAKKKFKQVIIATHSIEIISSVSPRNIITIDKESRKMRYAGDLEVVQDIVDDIGGNYNLSLINLNNSNKCLFVEGKDIKILQKFYDVCYPLSTKSIESIPYLPLGGFKKLNEAFGTAKLFYEQTKGKYNCFAILDSDYYTENQLEEQERKAKENNLNLHIWKKKEIENYLINPKVLFRLINNKQLKYTDFLQEYEQYVDTYKQDIIDAYTTMIQNESNNRIAAGTAAKMARDYVDDKWSNIEEKLSIVPGKSLLRGTNKWIYDNYKVHCSMQSIFNEMKMEDIDREIINVINQLVS